MHLHASTCCMRNRRVAFQTFCVWFCLLHILNDSLYAHSSPPRERERYIYIYNSIILMYILIYTHISYTQMPYHIPCLERKQTWIRRGIPVWGAAPSQYPKLLGASMWPVWSLEVHPVWTGPAKQQMDLNLENTTVGGVIIYQPFRNIGDCKMSCLIFPYTAMQHISKNKIKPIAA